MSRFRQPRIDVSERLMWLGIYASFTCIIAGLGSLALIFYISGGVAFLAFVVALGILINA